jgi:hypothetical protein
MIIVSFVRRVRGAAASYALIEVNSREEAVQAATDFMELHRKHWEGWDGESEVRKLFGPEDFGPGAAP